MSESYIFLYRLIMPVRWVDLDAYNHVNNARYFDAMSEARTQWFSELMQPGYPYQFVVVDTHCNYKRSFGYPATMIIDQYLMEVKNSSFSLFYHFFAAGDEKTIYAEGDAKLVCVDAKTLRATRLTEEIIRRLKN